MEAGPRSEIAEAYNCGLQLYLSHLPEQHFASYKVNQQGIFTHARKWTYHAQWYNSLEITVIFMCWKCSFNMQNSLDEYMWLLECHNSLEILFFVSYQNLFLLTSALDICFHIYFQIFWIHHGFRYIALKGRIRGSLHVFTPNSCKPSFLAVILVANILWTFTQV